MNLTRPLTWNAPSLHLFHLATMASSKKEVISVAPFADFKSLQQQQQQRGASAGGCPLARKEVAKTIKSYRDKSQLPFSSRRICCLPARVFARRRRVCLLFRFPPSDYLLTLF